MRGTEDNKGNNERERENGWKGGKRSVDGKWVEKKSSEL